MKCWIEIEFKKFGEINEKKLFKKEVIKRLNVYMKFWLKMSVFLLYSLIVKSKEIFEVLFEEFVKEIEKSCCKKEVYVEDLLVLIYIYYCIIGIEIG